MRRIFVMVAVLACLLGCAASETVGAAAASSKKKPPTETIAGTVSAHNEADFTITQSGKAAGRINEMIDYADKLAAKRYPYVYGGGHAHVQVPSTGTSGRKAKGFDCSATVAAVLAAAGLWPKHSSVPSDRGVIEDLLHRKVIEKGTGQGPYSVDLYDDPGDDIQMSIDGNFFGTGYTAKGGPAWMGEIPARYPKYKAYHIRPSALKDSSSDRHDVTFEFADSLAGFTLMQELVKGSEVQVSYHQSDGALVATAAKNIGGKPFQSG